MVILVRTLLGLSLVLGALSQLVGNLTAEYHLPINWFNCTSPGVCKTVNGALVIDANWRWLHQANNVTNCMSGGGWTCGSAANCTATCYLEGISQAQWANPYGISGTTCGTGVRLNYVTQGQYGQNVGGRLYLLASTSPTSDYQFFKLLNREFAFDVDTSQLDCGLNGGLYFVEMEKNGGKGKYSTNKAGAAYGTGYCDAQCPTGIPYVKGTANVDQYGACCAEMDIWEANKWVSTYTGHPCKTTGYYKCSGADCQTQCDKSGCDMNPYRYGNKTFYGPSSSTTKYTIDTTKPFTVITRFHTKDGLDTGVLSNITRIYIQNGKKYEQPLSTFTSIPKFNSLNDLTCKNQFGLYGAPNDLAAHGGLPRLGHSLANGVTLVFSLWDDYASRMLWLDSLYPTSSNPSTPGNLRGPCSTSSGDPNVLRASIPNAYAIYSNIKFGPIGSTY